MHSMTIIVPTGVGHTQMDRFVDSFNASARSLSEGTMNPVTRTNHGGMIALAINGSIAERRVEIPESWSPCTVVQALINSHDRIRLFASTP